MMPKQVKVGLQTFKIVEKTNLDDGMLSDGSYGYTLENQNLIVIDKNIPKSKKQVTVLHEVLHACRMSLEGPTRPKKSDDYETWEHHFIGIYENAVLMVMRDNPTLLKWLLEGDE
jgi:Zn-dependent peptidase ImmA (M78 family)